MWDELIFLFCCFGNSLSLLIKFLFFFVQRLFLSENVLLFLLQSEYLIFILIFLFLIVVGDHFHFWFKLFIPRLKLLLFFFLLFLYLFLVGLNADALKIPFSRAKWLFVLWCRSFLANFKMVLVRLYFGGVQLNFSVLDWDEFSFKCLILFFLDKNIIFLFLIRLVVIEDNFDDLHAILFDLLDFSADVSGKLSAIVQFFFDFCAAIFHHVFLEVVIHFL